MPPWSWSAVSQTRKLIDLKLGAQRKKLALSLVDGALYGPGACPLNRSLDTKFYFPHS